MSSTDFSTLPIQAGLLENLASLGYEQMTPIQAQALPDVLAGKDVIGQGKTGSGKTAAFGLGILEKLDTKRFEVQTLVLCPTRELADQVATEIRRLARAIPNVKIQTLCGGMPYAPQANSLAKGTHIVVGTPGRVEEHLARETLDLEALNTLVLDEADRMLDMGFALSLDCILDDVPVDRQTLLFSATFPQHIQQLSERVMENPTHIEVTSTHDHATIEQSFYQVEDNAQRITAVRMLLLKHRPDSTLIFCNTRNDVKEVAQELSDFGFSAMEIHGDLDQKERTRTLVRFANKSISILVATDVAARGIDIDSLDLVINYHVANDPEIHIHRIGRTGRAGNTGIACSIFREKEHHKLSKLEKYIGQYIQPSELPPVSLLKEPSFKPPMCTLEINGGKRSKLRPGDILGALTGENGIKGSEVGKIKVSNNVSYVAVHRSAAQNALYKLSNGKMKGKSFRIKQI